MRKFLIFTVPLLFFATMVGYLACSGQTRQVVVGNDSATAASGQTPAGGSFDQIDHSAWDALLRKYVDTDGMVNTD